MIAAQQTFSAAEKTTTNNTGQQIINAISSFVTSNWNMDLSLRDALGGGGGGAAGGAPAESLLKRDFVASLEKQSYDDKVGETVSKSEYRPLLDGKDSKTGK